MRRYIAVFAGFLMVVGLGIAVPTAATASSQTLPTVVRATPVNYTPNVLDGIVFSVAQAGNMIVLGGSFTQVRASSGGPILSRSYIVAFNKDTGAISTTFAPQFNATVRTVVASPDGQSVYVGGQFGSMNGASVPKVVKLNINNGARIAAFNTGAIDAVVHDMKLVGNQLYIGGSFLTIRGTTRTNLAAVDPTTGALNPNVNITFDGTHYGGEMFVHKFDVSPDGNTMVVTGNFRTMDGLDRVQVGMIDLSTGTATVNSWQTDAWKPMCYNSFAYYLNDLDFSPDGTFFTLGSMGGYGSGPPSLCDSISRWETNATGSGVTPSWVDYTGGDSIYALENTGAVVYFGGHNRWVNNPFRADAAGQGAVDRPGIGALETVNGMPITWAPGRDRGRGVFDLLATDQGLWVGSDTDRIAGGLYRARIAMFPTAGGTALPPIAVAPTLPVDVMQSGAINAPTDARYLYRVNSGGDTIPSLDGGMAWQGDTSPPANAYVNSGNSAGYDAVGAVTANVPASTPTAIFSSERWSPSDSPVMTYSFPVPAGTNVQVRLYLADRCSCTPIPGSRIFSTQLNGQPWLDSYDVNQSVGHNVGTMVSKDVVSTGTVTLSVTHNVENPAVNGVEIFNLDAAAPLPSEVNKMTNRYFDGSTGSNSTGAVSGSVAWDSVRGGFVANGALYLATTSGEFMRAPFNGTTVGSATALELYGLTNFSVDMQSMTGLFYSNGRIYYTLAGQSSLFMRYFSLNSGIVGAQRFAVTGPAAGMDWKNVNGMFLADGKIYWASSDGNLNSMGWSDNVVSGTVTGTSTVVSGPSQDGVDWAAKSLIDKPGTGSTVPPKNQAPVAAFTTACTNLVCSFNGATSTDSDGTIASYVWNSSDGGSGTSATFNHTFTAAGSYQVTLTVTDDDGATGAVTKDVTATAPPANVAPTAAFTPSCANLVCSFDGSGSSDSDGTVTSYAWTSSDGGTGSSAVFNRTFTAADTYQVTLTVTDDDGATGAVTHDVTVTAAPPGNVAPTAAFTADCTYLTCILDGSTSADSDGTIADYAWTIPGNPTLNGVTVSQTFAAAGTFDVVLTVTDNGGATGVFTLPVTVTEDPGPPSTSPVQFVATAASNNSGSVMSHSVVLPASVQAGDVLVAAFSTNSGTVGITEPAGWSVSAESATTSMRGIFLTKVAVAADAGATVTVRTAAYGRGTLAISAYRNATVTAASFALQSETVSRAAHVTPVISSVISGSWAVQYWADKTGATTSWTVPAGQTVRQTGAGTGAGHLSWLFSDANGPLSGTDAGGLTATANSSSPNAVMGTVVLAPATSSPNVAPTAAFTTSCTNLVCSFNGATSADSDGTIASYTWSSSDGGNGALGTFDHTFGAAGVYQVTLTVTDNGSATNAVTHDVTVTAAPVGNPPVAAFTADCTYLVCTLDGSTSTDPDGGALTEFTWTLPGSVTATGEVVSYSFPDAGTYPVTMVVKNDSGAAGTVTSNVTVDADPNPPVSTPVAFVDSVASTNTGSVLVSSVTIPGTVQAGDVMIASFGTNSGTVDVTAPAGWAVVATANTASMRGMFITKVAVASDAGSTLSMQTANYGRATLVLSAYRNAQLAAASFVMQPETVSRAAHTTPTATAASGDWVLQYWSDKTAATTGWTAPAGQTVRQTGAGTGAGHLSWLQTDSNGPITGTTAGGSTATASSSSASAVMGTVVISPATP